MGELQELISGTASVHLLKIEIRQMMYGISKLIIIVEYDPIMVA